MPSSGASNGGKRLPPHIQRGVDLIRENGLCGEVSGDLAYVCLKDADHDDEHGDRNWPVNMLGRADDLDRLLRIRAAALDLAGTPTRQPIDLNYVAIDKDVWEAFRAVLERSG